MRYEIESMKCTQKKLKGLSLLEVMVSMGIFSMMMVAIAGIFGSSIQSSRANRNIEHDLENAQFVMNDIAKQLRTSTIVSWTAASVRFYDYSQGRCIEYRDTITIIGHAIQKSSFVIPDRSLCDTSGSTDTLLNNSGYIQVTTGYVAPTFSVVTSSLDTVTPANSRVGKVTMMFEVKEKSASTRSARIQTTVSLRDYVESGVVQAN
jgi:Tfp pilus assembly protein PilV